MSGDVTIISFWLHLRVFSEKRKVPEEDVKMTLDRDDQCSLL